MLKIFLIISLFIFDLSALVYEDAEDLTTKRWAVVSSEYSGKISNVFNKAKTSRVIKLDGNGTKSIYQLHIPHSLENIQMDNSFFTWEMNYLEDFVILIVIDTIKGERHLIYTPDGKNSYLQYGLNRVEKGKWKKYSRNLEKDLQIYEKKNKIIDIKYFVIKGSGLVDNIHLKRLNKEKAIVSPIIKNVVEKKAKLPLLEYKDDILPIIKLKGKNPLLLKVGEEYVEEGATARNRDGSKINVIITNNIDTLIEGEYTVIYIATNKLGNSSIDKRRVAVGDILKKKPNEPLENDEEVLKEEKIEKVEEVLEEVQKEHKVRPLRPGL